MGHAKRRRLDGEEERALARRIVQAEAATRDAVKHLDEAKPHLRRKRKGSERTRAGDVDALGRAVEAVWDARNVSDDHLRAARAARASWAEAEALRWELAMSASHIAWGEARKLAGAFLELEDLAQEGFVGLMRAAKRFDPERDIRFSTYARWWVRAAMTRAVDTTGRTVRLPGCAVEQTRNLRKAMTAFERIGHDYSIADVANEVGLDVERAEFLLSRGRTVSLDEPVDDGPKARPLGDLLLDEDAEAPDDNAIHAQEVERMFAATREVLDDRHRYVITKRYGLEDANFLSLSAIARSMDLSRERVRQLEREALEVMRQMGSIRDQAA